MIRTASLICLLTLGACAETSSCARPPLGDAQEAAAGDPFTACDPGQSLNQGIFAFNLAADKYVIGPIAHGYHELPQTGRTAISNFLTNLSEPNNVLNSSLQGDFQSAGTSLWRFLLNSTIGFAGVRDFAGENGLRYHEQNFNRTLASYGVGTGPYIVLPLLGPSSVRDTTGKVVDWFADPVNIVLNNTASIGLGVANGINTREEQDDVIQQLYYDAVDPYNASRAAYLQREQAQ